MTIFQPKFKPKSMRDWHGAWTSFNYAHIYKPRVAMLDMSVWKLLHLFPEKKKPEDFFRADIEDFRLMREREGASQWTIKNDVRAIRAFFNWIAARYEMLLLNPTAGVEIVATKPSSPRPMLSLAEVERLLAVANASDDLSLFVRLALTTGLSGMELFNLKWDAVSTDGLTARGRILPLREDVVALLQKRPRTGLRVFHPWAKSMETLRNRWKALLKLAKVEHVPLKSLQRTAAILLVRAGAAQEEVLLVSGLSERLRFPSERTLQEAQLLLPR